MTNKSKIVTFSILGLLAITVFIQYEIREYVRFVPSDYWFLKFALHYFVGTFLVLISAVGGIKLFVKQKTLINSMPLIIVLAGLTTVWVIRQQTKPIAFENIILKNNLYVDSASGILLDGTYKSPSQWDGFGIDEHCWKGQFENGIPIGKWMYSYKGDLIHAGEYLEKTALNDRLRERAKCKRVDINVWQEGDNPILTIDLINPILKDSATLETISDLTIQMLQHKFKFKTLFIDEVSSKERTTLIQKNIP